mgnify:CR=1 FL=1
MQHFMLIRNISWFQINFQKKGGGRLLQRVIAKTHFLALNTGVGLYTGIYGNGNELSEAQFNLILTCHYCNFKTERARIASQVWFQTIITRREIQLPILPF